jgi:hypothetical protein
MKPIAHFSFFHEEFWTNPDCPKDFVIKDNGSSVQLSIPIDHPSFDLVLTWAKKHQNISIGDFATISKNYSRDEIEAAELFLFAPKDAPGELLAAEYGTKYQLVQKVNQFHIKKQDFPLIINTHRLSKKLDIQKILSNEIVINSRLKVLLESWDASGFELLPVFTPKDVRADGDVDIILDPELVETEHYFQLVVTSATAVIATPNTKIGKETLDFTLEPSKHTLGDEFIPGIAYDSKIYLKRDKYDGADFVHTHELVFDEYPQPLIFISKRIYELFKINKVTGFDSEPVKLI